MIPFAQHTPDLAPLNAGLLKAQNVIPEGGHYAPWLRLNAFTGALGARCLGAISGKGQNGAINTFAGDAGKLYKLSATAWNDTSKAGGYATPSMGFWDFAEYEGRVIAANGNDTIQSFLIGSSSLFADLSATAPVARYVARFDPAFVVAGYTDNASDEVAWSPYNSPTGVWTPDVDTQAGRQSLSEGGVVTGLVGGSLRLAFLERAIYRLTYVGPPVTFQVDQVAFDHGCLIPGTLAAIESRAIYYSDSGFYMTDGQSRQPIGANRVDRTFAAGKSDADDHRMSAVMDERRKLYILTYVSSSGAGGAPDSQLIYNWEIDRWSEASDTIDRLASIRSAVYTLEQVAALFANLDAITPSLDDPTWAGGDRWFGGFDASFQFGRLDGGALAAVIDTGETQIYPPRRATVTGVRPLVDAASTVQMGTRNLQSDSVSFNTAVSPHSRTGLAPFLSDARYHRARVNIAECTSWTQAVGIDVEARRGGLQ